MGAGVARVIAKRYPEVEADYRAFCRAFDPVELLGRVQVLQATEYLWVVNVFGQLDTGRGLQTDYSAVSASLVALSERYFGGGPHPALNVPYMMGCGLAGGDWDVYSAILDEHWPGVVVAHRLPSRASR